MTGLDLNNKEREELMNRIKNKVTDYAKYSSGETLLDKVRLICRELADYGWRRTF